MDALDTLLNALGIPEYNEEGYSKKGYYEAYPEYLAELLAKNLKDHPEAVFLYLFNRNKELEDRVEELETWKGDFLHDREMEEYYEIHRSEEE